MWILGTWLACVAVLHAWSDSVAGTLARQSAVSSVRRTTLERNCKDSDKTTSGEPLRSGTSSSGQTSPLVEAVSVNSDYHKIMCVLDSHCVLTIKCFHFIL